MSNEQLSGYNTKSILLTKTNFIRERVFPLDKPVESKLEVNVEVGFPNETEIVTTVLLHYKGIIEGKVIFDCEIEMSGHFEKIGTPSVPQDEFARINGASIVFPFIREHLASISTKSGFHSILLPPFNFAALAKSKKDSEGNQ